MELQKGVLDHTVGHGIAGQLSDGLCTNGLHDAVLVEFHRARRDIEDGGNFLGRPALGNELQDLFLAGSQFRSFLIGMPEAVQDSIRDEGRDMGSAPNSFFARSIARFSTTSVNSHPP